MPQHYVLFTENQLPQPEAHLVWAANSANAVANLGYPSLLVYLKKGQQALNPLEWASPCQLKQPSQDVATFYNLQDELKTVALPVPWPIDRWKHKWTNSSTLVCKYYFPFHIIRLTKIVHSRHWNFVKAAVQNGIPAIYEHHHFEKKKFEPEIAQSPLLQLVITVADNIKESLIQSGIPSEKIVKLQSGFNQSFTTRQAELVEAWRQTLLGADYRHLVVYSGGLYSFKGVDMLLDVAQQLPEVHFVFAGGKKPQVDAYQQLAQEKQVKNATFLGYVTHDKLPSLLQAADILAHPHCKGQAATFTSPLKFFEYMASGTPIVSTEISPLMEFKSSNTAVAWCEPDQPMQFAQCIQHVLEIYPRRVEGYVNNVEFALQFSWESRATQILSLIDESARPMLIT